MAPHCIRMALRFTGVICLAAGLLPYYSHTSGPSPAEDIPPIEIPLVGPLPTRSASTTVRLGLPFSPLFQYHREDAVTAENTVERGKVDAITVRSGDTAIVGNVKTVLFSSRFSANWHIEMMSWSSLLIVAGMVILLLSFFVCRCRAMPTAIAAGASPQAAEPNEPSTRGTP